MAKSKKHNNKKTLILIALTLALAYGAYYYFKNNMTSPSTIAVLNSQGGVTMALSPASVALDVGETKTFDLVVNSGSEHLTGVGAIITYDPSKLEVTKVDVGTYLPIKLAAPHIDSAAGRVKFDLGSTTENNGVVGQGTIATLTVKVKAAGSLTLSEDSLAYTTEHTDSTLKTVGGAEITIAAAASPSVAASAEPGASPTPSTTRTNFRTKYDPTCTSITYQWDKINYAQGYYVDISSSSDFKDFTSSGQLGSDRGEITFNDLKNDTTYYARLTLAGIPNFPDYNYSNSSKTKCGATASPTASPTSSPTATPTSTAKPTVKPTVKPTATPSTKPSSSPATSVAPGSVGKTIGDIVGNPSSSPVGSSAPTTTHTKMTFFEWLLSVISNFFAGK